MMLWCWHGIRRRSIGRCGYVREDEVFRAPPPISQLAKKALPCKNHCTVDFSSSWSIYILCQQVMAAGVLKERKSLDELYGTPETGFAEFIPTDSYVESYFESLDGMTDGSVGCGQDKGARKPAQDSSGT